MCFCQILVKSAVLNQNMATQIHVNVYQWVHDPYLVCVKSKYNYDVIDEWDVSLCHNRMVMFDGLS